MALDRIVIGNSSDIGTDTTNWASFTNSGHAGNTYNQGNAEQYVKYAHSQSPTFSDRYTFGIVIDGYTTSQASNLALHMVQYDSGNGAEGEDLSVEQFGQTNTNALPTTTEFNSVEYTNTSGTVTGWIVVYDSQYSSSSSGSGSSQGVSQLSWAYSSQTATDPNIIMDWESSPDFSITADTTDVKADIKAIVTAASLNINDLLVDFVLNSHNDKRNNQSDYRDNFVDYIYSRINTQ